MHSFSLQSLLLEVFMGFMQYFRLHLTVAGPDFRDLAMISQSPSISTMDIKRLVQTDTELSKLKQQATSFLKNKHDVIAMSSCPTILKMQYCLKLKKVR